MYTLDTNAIIYYLRDDTQAALLLNKIFSDTTYINTSAISEVELFSYKQMTDSEKEKIENILNTLFSVPLDSNIARVAGEIRRTINISLPDSIIAATAINTRTTLVTRNIRDFKKVPGLPLLKI